MIFTTSAWLDLIQEGITQATLITVHVFQGQHPAPAGRIKLTSMPVL